MNIPKYVNSILSYYKEKKDNNTLTLLHAEKLYGCLEAALILSDYWTPNYKFEYQIREFVDIGLFSKNKVQRMENYGEMIIRNATQYLATVKKGEDNIK
jgi:hypothetical protein